jgi:hypothetical protein
MRVESRDAKAVSLDNYGLFPQTLTSLSVSIWHPAGIWSLFYPVTGQIPKPKWHVAGDSSADSQPDPSRIGDEKKEEKKKKKKKKKRKEKKKGKKERKKRRARHKTLIFVLRPEVVGGGLGRGARTFTE